MKLKTLKKKIRRLEKRLREGPIKLAQLKEDLAEMESEEQAATRTRAARRGATKTAARKRKPGAKAATPAKSKKATALTALVKTKRNLDISPERRLELSAQMKARWAARKSVSVETAPQTLSIAQDSTGPENSQRPEVAQGEN